MLKVVLVGAPNVGKSVIFNYLTGSYISVSNYPGTTVDIASGKSKIGSKTYEVFDTPGMYSFIPITEEERVTRQLLQQEKPDLIIHVIDAKNIKRMLVMTLQLIETGYPVILNLNMMDEAKDRGILIKIKLLSEILGIPVIATSAVKRIGLENLKKAIFEYQHNKKVFHSTFSENIEQAINGISTKLQRQYNISLRTTALLLMQNDNIMHEIVKHEQQYKEIMQEITTVSQGHNLEYMLTLEYQRIVDKICSNVLTHSHTQHKGIKDYLDTITREPITGIPILCLILFLGIYKFVGGFGAGILVDYIDDEIFCQYINPIIENIVNIYIPWEWLQSFIIGKYGIFSLGFRYAFVIILPIVGSFFLAFSILEDCGYLPRLAMLVDKVFKCLGLNGRAIIPIALGLGCGTMAVMVTRTLETRRERIIATFLLALTIPCSAQLGVVMAILSDTPRALAVWAVYICLIFIIVGWLSAQIIPGKRSAFYIELPPLRLPTINNVMKKAYIRMYWYFIEILPVFIITSAVMWYCDRSGYLAAVIKAVEPVMSILGLPTETANIFLLGFFRRDYGAAGLYEMCSNGSLSNEQLLIASVTLTLFVPCIAQVAVMIKERGIVIASIMVMLIIIAAVAAGVCLHWLIYLFNFNI